MKPTVYKIKDSFFINKSLVEFIDSKMANLSTEIHDNEVLYFMRNVKFQRGLLDICPKKLSRVVKPENATTIIVEHMQFGKVPFFLDGNTVHQNVDGKVDDTVYSLFNMSDLDMLSLKGWIEIYESKKDFKYVLRTKAEQEINSGFVIDESNIETFIGAIETDRNFVINTINSCDFEKSKLFILYLLFFTSDRWNASYYQDINLMTPTFVSKLVQISCRSGATKHMLTEMYKNPTLYSMLYPRISSKLHTQCANLCNQLNIKNIEYIIELN